VSAPPPKQVLVAGIGNAWMKDDAFGGEVAARLQARGLPSGVSVFDFGTGGLNLAYEVMRGYDALILVDISRQGGEPGTLYVMEPDENSVDPSLDNGEIIDPHGMDPQTVLRFVKGVGGWPGKVVVIACEPMEVEEMGLGMSAPVQSSLDRAVDLVAETALELLSDAAYEKAPEGSRDA
jgi:hydrogenase maturation protease